MTLVWDFLWCSGPSGFLCIHMCAKLKGKWLYSTAEEPWSWTMCFALRPGVFTMKRDISPPRPFINFYGERVRARRGIPNSSRWSIHTHASSFPQKGTSWMGSKKREQNVQNLHCRLQWIDIINIKATLNFSSWPHAGKYKSVFNHLWRKIPCA